MHDIEPKLQELRKKYADSAESQRTIDQYETDLIKLFEEKRLVDNPIIQAIFKDAEKKLNEINALLMNDETLTQEQRIRLFSEKKVWHFMFNRFKMVPHDNAIDAMRQIIDAKLNQ